MNDEGGKYILTEWGCLAATLNNYGIDFSHITGEIGKHLVEDFMELMVRCGHAEKVNDD